MMKNLMILLTLLGLIFNVWAKEKVTIKALNSVELTYEEFATYDVKISNSSGKPIDVAVLDPVSKKQQQGFGLGPMGRVVVSVGKGQILKLKNNTTSEVSLTLYFVEREKPKYRDNPPVVNFTLHNSSIKSIPLIIPGVMNPNLSPISNSGVALEMGQKIYYRNGREKTLILVVDENIQAGDKIDVAKLIKDLKKD